VPNNPWALGKVTGESQRVLPLLIAWIRMSKACLGSGELHVQVSHLVIANLMLHGCTWVPSQK
jgi:hypothetical protein